MNDGGYALSPPSSAPTKLIVLCSDRLPSLGRAAGHDQRDLLDENRTSAGSGPGDQVFLSPMHGNALPPYFSAHTWIGGTRRLPLANKPQSARPESNMRRVNAARAQGL